MWISMPLAFSFGVISIFAVETLPRASPFDLMLYAPSGTE
jgi:hypothetical protein